MAPTLETAAGAIIREVHWSGQVVAGRTQVDVVLVPWTAPQPAAVLEYGDEMHCLAMWRIGRHEIARTSGTREQCTRWISRGYRAEVAP